MTKKPNVLETWPGSATSNQNSQLKCDKGPQTQQHKIQLHSFIWYRLTEKISASNVENMTRLHLVILHATHFPCANLSQTSKANVLLMDVFI